MKKLLNISVIAALAILPMAANAVPYSVDDPVSDANAAAAQTDPKWALAEAGGNDGNLATAGYVKGAYNQTMKAINKLEDTKQDALSSEQLTAISNVSGLSTRMDAAEDDIDALETTVGDSTSGLVKAVADNTTDISALETTVGDSTSGLVKDVDDLQTTVGDSTSGLVKDVDDLQTTVGDSTSGLVKDVADLQTASADYAKKIGVTHTISSSTIAGTVPTVTVWGADTPGTAPITASITGATYTETAPTPAGN